MTKMLRNFLLGRRWRLRFRHGDYYARLGDFTTEGSRDGSQKVPKNEKISQRLFTTENIKLQNLCTYLHRVPIYKINTQG